MSTPLRKFVGCAAKLFCLSRNPQVAFNPVLCRNCTRGSQQLLEITCSYLQERLFNFHPVVVVILLTNRCLPTMILLARCFERSSSLPGESTADEKGWCSSSRRSIALSRDPRRRRVLIRLLLSFLAEATSGIVTGAIRLILRGPSASARISSGPNKQAGRPPFRGRSRPRSRQR